MLFRQITHDDLGCAPYLVGEENASMICSSRQRSAPAVPLWERSGWPVERAVPARV
jgi:hypothetical protein